MPVQRRETKRQKLADGSTHTRTVTQGARPGGGSSAIPYWTRKITRLPRTPFSALTVVAPPPTPRRSLGGHLLCLAGSGGTWSSVRLPTPRPLSSGLFSS